MTSTSPRKPSRRRSSRPPAAGRTTGLPPNPAAWITTTARNRAIDRLRREAKRATPAAGGAAARHRLGAATSPTARPELRGGARAGRPAAPDLHLLPPGTGAPTQVALTLRLVGGLQTPEIARAFLVPEPTMAQRLVRAKRKIRGAGSPSGSRATASSRTGSARPRRHLPGLQRGLRRVERSGRWSATTCAPRRCGWPRLLHELMPDEPRGAGAARPAAADRRPPRRAPAPDGSLVRLPDQDRRSGTAADPRGSGAGPALPAPQPARPLPAAGRHRRGPQRRRPARSTPTGARSSQLYDQLLAGADAVVALNRAVALAELAGPGAALAEVDGLDLPAYHLFHLTRGDLLERLGRRRGGRRGVRTGPRADRQRSRAGRAGPAPDPVALTPALRRRRPTACDRAPRPWPRTGPDRRGRSTASALSPGWPTAIPAEHVQSSETDARRRSVTSVAIAASQSRSSSPNSSPPSRASRSSAAQLVAPGRSGGLEQAVAGRVPVGVVERLEVVEVDHRDDQPRRPRRARA